MFGKPNQTLTTLRNGQTQCRHDESFRRKARRRVLPQMRTQARDDTMAVLHVFSTTRHPTDQNFVGHTVAWANTAQQTAATPRADKRFVTPFFFFLFGWHRNRTNWSPRREKYTHATSMCNKQPRSDQASPSPPLQRTQRHVPAEPQAQAARLILRRCRGRDNNGKHAPQEQQLANT